MQQSANEETEARARAHGELLIGHHCFALAKLVEWEWYCARLVRVRARQPQLQVEYLATLDGNTSPLALPVPRINHIPLEHVCLQRPAFSEGPVVPPVVPCIAVPGLEMYS